MQLSLVEPIEARVCRKYTHAGVRAGLERMKAMVRLGVDRETMAVELQLNDQSLRNWLRRCKAEMGAEYRKPPVRKAGEGAGFVPRDNERLAKIDRQLRKAKKCPTHKIRMFGGTCFDCDNRAERSTGMGQSMVAFAAE